MSILRLLIDEDEFQDWLYDLPRDGTYHEVRNHGFVKRGVSLGFFVSNEDGVVTYKYKGRDIPKFSREKLFLASDLCFAFRDTGVWVRKPRKVK